MALFDGFRSMSPRLQQQGYKSPWTYLRDIAQQSPQQFSGYPSGFNAPPAPNYAPRPAQQPAYPAAAPSFTPPGSGTLPSAWYSRPLPQNKYNLAPGQSGSAYDIGGGRMLYTGGAQSPTSFARGNARRLKSQLDQMRGGLGVQYDPSQFSDNLNYYLNNRVLGYNRWAPERKNDFLDRLIGFRELESARRAASPEYAQLSQQYASAPRGIIR